LANSKGLGGVTNPRGISAPAEVGHGFDSFLGGESVEGVVQCRFAASLHIGCLYVAIASFCHTPKLQIPLAIDLLRDKGRDTLKSS